MKELPHLKNRDEEVPSSSASSCALSRASSSSSMSSSSDSSESICQKISQNSSRSSSESESPTRDDIFGNPPLSPNTVWLTAAIPAIPARAMEPASLCESSFQNFSGNDSPPSGNDSPPWQSFSIDGSDPLPDEICDFL